METQALPTVDPSPRALIQQLSDAGYSPERVSGLLDNEPSNRTLYRWWKDGVSPQRKSDFQKVLKLAKTLGISIQPG